MHVLPLPFGMAVAVLPRREAERMRKPKSAFVIHREATPRERILTETRYAEFRQRVA